MRSRILQFAFLLFASAFMSATQAASIGEDGLHKLDWFAITFKDVAEDIAESTDDGKRLAIVFEQRGCIYCKKMHEQILSDPEVADYLKANFRIVQYNLFGDEEVIDLDGETLSEKEAARKWQVVFTPTILFMPEHVPEADDGKPLTAASAAVAVMPGAFGRLTFLNMFKWVKEQGYAGDEHFQKYHARIINELREAGKLDSE